jgi:peptidoglycan/xylan/chitin deacetylase (PgdA/CDA1 family)
VRRGPADRRIVALTFDAGSDTGYGSRILDTLAADGIHATFGMTGVWAEANPGLVRRMVAEGHQLVNHTYDHRSFTGRSPGTPPLSRSERLSELARAEAAVRTAGGVGMSPWFRPPYGDEDESVRVDAGAAGYQYELLWTVDSLGWKGVAPAEVTQRCLDAATPGAIYLMHVGVASTDHAALRALIDGLRSRGYTFATASELVAG